MPRRARFVLPGCPHHVTQRGNNRANVFFSDHHRNLYLSLLKEYTAKYKVTVLGYCLMTNHVHLILVPESAAGLANALGRTHHDYARYLHISRQECGHLWQNRYFSCPLESAYTWAALAYVERNPVRAGLVPSSELWLWSSARHHLGLPHHASDWLNTDLWSQTWTPDIWRIALEDGLAEGNIQARLREATLCGKPLGEDRFITHCERASGLTFRKQKRGRKPKASALQLVHEAPQQLICA